MPSDVSAAPAPSDAPVAGAPGTPAADDQIRFSAGQIEYDIDAEIVTATGEVRMTREGERLRADRVTWNRTTGRVVATGGVAVANPAGDVAYGDSIELTDSLKDGVVDNLLVVLEQGGRLAADKGTRQENGTYLLDRAAYSPCAVIDAEGCPKDPSWNVTAVRIAYRPDRSRVYFTRPGFHLFGLPTIPLPSFSTAVGGGSDNGFLNPNFGYSRANGVNVTTPYYFRLAPWSSRSLPVSPVRNAPVSAS